MEKTRVVINVETWGQHALLNDDGTKCCLGFICEQALGVETKKLKNQTYYPLYMIDVMPDWYNNRRNRAAGINDSSYTREEKMSMLKELFADTPVELVFTENGIELP